MEEQNNLYVESELTPWDKYVNSEQKRKMELEGKLKRFANAELAFRYFLKELKYYILDWGNSDYLNFQLELRSQRNWLKIIFEKLTGDWRNPQFEILTNEMELINNKESNLSRNERDFLKQVFNWVEHFVVKDGEEITMDERDLVIPTEELMMRKVV